MLGWSACSGNVIAVAVGLLIAFLAPACHHLTVEDEGDRLAIRFGPLALLHRTVRYDDMLLLDKEDLIHKAAGWMLREVGKRDQPALEAFLMQDYRKIPRTMLRYAIERFGKEDREAYLKGLL